MAENPQTYQRARSGALLGLGVQIVFVLVLLLLALFKDTQHPTTWVVFLFALGGIPIWCCLALLFHQHRLERIEALENEQLQQQAGQVESSIFERGAADWSIAQKRLKFFHRWLVPISALAVGFHLAFYGVLRISQVTQLVASKKLPLPPVPDELFMAMAFAAGLTFLGFVVSRYLAGVAQEKECQFLQGGAGYLMGTALITGLLTVGLALVRYDSPAFISIVHAILPIAFLLLSCEILLSVLLGVYRPRRAGEVSRPAFDSRILGLLMAPESMARTLQDAVNYQFGFEVTRSWFWKFLERAALPLLGLGVALLLLMSAVVIVEPHQQAMVSTMGRLADEPMGPGIHLKWPWPFSEAKRYDVTHSMEVRVGSVEALDHSEDEHGGQHDNAPYLWSNDHSSHTGGMLIVAAPDLAEPATLKGSNRKAVSGTRMPTVSVVLADIPVQYRIRDLLKYARCTGNAERLLINVAEREVSMFMCTRQLDALLGPERSSVGPILKQRIQAAADQLELGIEIVFVGVSGVHPHKDVATAFYETVEARQEKFTTIEKAKQAAIKELAQVAGRVDLAERIILEIEKLEKLRAAGQADSLSAQEAKLDTLLVQAGGTASRLISEARANRWQRENEERGKAERFSSEVKAHQAAPRVYRLRKYMDVLATGLANSRKYILLSNRDDLEVRLDLKDGEMNLPSLDQLEKK